MLCMACNVVEIQPVLQDITGEELNRGANTTPDARLDIVARGCFLWCENLPPKCRLLQGYGSKPDSQST